jgi:hypothetical protein
MIFAVSERSEAELEERETENEAERERERERERESWHEFFYGKPFCHNPPP